MASDWGWVQYELTVEVNTPLWVLKRMNELFVTNLPYRNRATNEVCELSDYCRSVVTA